MGVVDYITAKQFADNYRHLIVKAKRESIDWAAAPPDVQAALLALHQNALLVAEVERRKKKAAKKLANLHYMGIFTQQLKAECAKLGVHYVGTKGNPRAPLWIVGEAPGEKEDTAFLPFVGASGQELDRMISEAGLFQSDICFTNPYKVRPPNNELPRLAERGIDPKLMLQQFLEELYEYKPTIMVLCGATALGILCPQTVSKKDNQAKIGTWRGSLLQSNKINWPHYIIPMYHPAFILREWGERQIAVFCLARAAEELSYWKQNGKLQPLPTRELIARPSYDDLYAYLHDILQSEAAVSSDIEMLSATLPYTVALAKSPTCSMSFSLWDYELDQLVKIWRMLDEVLRTKPQIGQNYLGFDCHWLSYLGFSPNASKVDDTMVAHHVLWPEFPHKLQFLGFQYTREPYWKDEGRLWHPKDGKERLMRYNALDAAATYEIFQKEVEELNDRGLMPFYADYEMRLARHFYSIEERGVQVDIERLGKLREEVLASLDKETAWLEKTLAKPCAPSKEAAIAAAKALGIVEKEVFNLNAPQQVIEVLKGRGLKIPKDRRTGKESSKEEYLQKIYAETGDDAIKHFLVTRGLNKILGTYINVQLSKDHVLYSSYVVTGTVTGRRSSRANFLGYGTNHQNFPKHSDLGERFLACLVARPGRILINCDQVQAEDWLVQGIIADTSGNRCGLEELIQRIDRHKKLASFIFGVPEDQCGKGTMRRYLGKKTRHAGNYDMGPETFSLALAKDGYTVPIKHCEQIMQKFHEFDPCIRGVYHKWVQKEIQTNRMLRTPHGRERFFLDARPYSDNHKVFREAYSYVPQSTVGDNTGKAVVFLEDRKPGMAILESHDAVVLEVADDDAAIIGAVRLLQEAFNIELTLQNGLRLTIPIEVEVGYDLSPSGMTACDSLDEVGLLNTVNGLRAQRSLPLSTTCGVQPQLSAPA